MKKSLRRRRRSEQLIASLIKDTNDSPADGQDRFVGLSVRLDTAWEKVKHELH